MRYYEILEAQSAVEKAAKEQERKRRANHQIDTARRQKVDGMRKQQEVTRAANEKERTAKLALAKAKS